MTTPSPSAASNATLEAQSPTSSSPARPPSSPIATAAATLAVATRGPGSPGGSDAVEADLGADHPIGPDLEGFRASWNVSAPPALRISEFGRGVGPRQEIIAQYIFWSDRPVGSFTLTSLVDDEDRLLSAGLVWTPGREARAPPVDVRIGQGLLIRSLANVGAGEADTILRALDGPLDEPPTIGRDRTVLIGDVRLHLLVFPDALLPRIRVWLIAAAVTR